VVDVTPIRDNFVADISDIDVKQVSDAEFEQVYRAWLQYGVLRIRNQSIDEDGLQAFSVRFGPLEEIPMGRMSEEMKAKIKNRYVTQLSNIVVDGKPIGGLGNSEANWHSDMTYVDVPPPASILLGVEIPDAAHTSIGQLRPGFEAFDDPRDAPGAVHPIIQKHGETGRKVLYLGRREWAYIPGLELQESEALLDELWSYAALPEAVWRQKWQPGDVIVWDNRRVLHRRDDFDQNSRRLMKRCQVLARTTQPAPLFSYTVT